MVFDDVVLINERKCIVSFVYHSNNSRVQILMKFTNKHCCTQREYLENRKNFFAEQRDLFA